MKLLGVRRIFTRILSNFPEKFVCGVAIGKLKRQVRKVSHCGSKEQ